MFGYKYKGCVTCDSEAKAYAQKMEHEMHEAQWRKEEAEKRLAAKEKCIDWVWVVRWTTPGMRQFSCSADRAYIRLFSCKEDALALVIRLRDLFGMKYDNLGGYSCGGGSANEPEEVGNFYSFPGGYSLAIQCRAVNSSPCEFAREYDIDGNPIEKKGLAHGCASTQQTEKEK